MSIESILAQYQTLSAVSKSAVGAVVGACVADAATRPVHWVYDRSVIESAIGGNPNPEFWSTSLSPFYTLETGRRSCYNDESMVMLQSLSRGQPYRSDAMKAALMTMYSPDSEYASSLALRKKAYDPSQRTQKREPIPGPWQHSAVTYFLKSMEEGKDETGDPETAETDGFCLSIPLIARLSSESNDSVFMHPERFRTTISECIMTLSGSQIAINHGLARAQILEKIIRSSSSVEGSRLLSTRIAVGEIIRGYSDESIRAEFEEVLKIVPSGYESDDSSVWDIEMLSAAFLDASQTFSKACADPGNFQLSLLILLSTNSYSEAVRRNLLAGGCNCSRANFVGACMGAIFGIGGEKGIPVEWIVKTDVGARVLELAMQLFGGGDSR